MLSLSLRLTWSTRTLRNSQNIEVDSLGYWELSMVPVSQVSSRTPGKVASWQVALLELPPPQFKLVNDSILWAVKHTMRDIADLGLSSMSLSKTRERGRWQIVAFDLVNNFATASPEIANQFFQQYMVNLLGDILYVLTDADHKSGMSLTSLHITILTIRLQEPIDPPCSTYLARRNRSSPSTIIRPRYRSRPKYVERNLPPGLRCWSPL